MCGKDCPAELCISVNEYAGARSTRWYESVQPEKRGDGCIEDEEVIYTLFGDIECKIASGDCKVHSRDLIEIYVPSAEPSGRVECDRGGYGAG